jgi:AcrR family transcriptional regulator
MASASDPAVPPGAATPTRISRDLLIDACARTVAADGVDAVTMRRIGSELGVDPTAFYRYFRSKEELLLATADRLLVGAFDRFEISGDWKRDLRAFCLHMRSVYLAHPGLARLIETANVPLPNEARMVEAWIGLLRSAGFSDADAVASCEVLETYTIAVSGMDDAAPDDASTPWVGTYTALPPAEYPNLNAVGDQLYQDPDARFAYGLDLLLDSIERRRGSR